MTFNSSQIIVICEACNFLCGKTRQKPKQKKITLSELYLFVLRNSLTISVYLFEPVSAVLGRYIPFSKQEYFVLLGGNDHQKISRWKWIDPEQIFYDKARKKHYAFGKRQSKVYGVWDLPMIGTETKHIESLFLQEKNNGPLKIMDGHVLLKRGNRLCKLIVTLPDEELVENQERIEYLKSEIQERLYDKRVDGYSTHYSIKAKPSESDIKEAKQLEKELSKASKLPTKNPAKNYSALSDFAHELVFKKDNLDKLANDAKKEKSPEETGLTPKGTGTIRTLIGAFLPRQGITLNQHDVVEKLRKLIILNNFMLPDDAIKRCINVLRHGTLDEELLATIKEEELLIILSSLLHQEKIEKSKTLVKHIRKLMKDSAPAANTINNYLRKIANIDRRKYSIISDDCEV